MSSTSSGAIGTRWPARLRISTPSHQITSARFWCERSAVRSNGRVSMAANPSAMSGGSSSRWYRKCTIGANAENTRRPGLPLVRNRPHRRTRADVARPSLLHLRGREQPAVARQDAVHCIDLRVLDAGLQPDAAYVQRIAGARAHTLTVLT